MSCTEKQRKLIEDLMEEGAPIPEHQQFDRPDDSMFHSVEAADKFIKTNYHYLAKKAGLKAKSRQINPSDWGGVLNT